MPRVRTRSTRRSSVRAAGFVAGVVGLALVLLVGGTLLLTRYLEQDVDDESTLPPQVDRASAPLDDTLLARPIDYVALGDSYSAGPGLPPQDGEPAACLRSSSNYATQLADWLDAASFADVTCTGARTSDITGSQTRPDGTVVPPQLDALDADTDLVTLGIGGNDSNVFQAVVGTCPEAAASDPEGSPCQEELAPGGEDDLDRQSDQIRTRVTALVRAIRAQAPSAAVVLVGYPGIFPTDGTCEALGFTPDDALWASRVVGATSDGLAAAADGTGVRYVDLIAPSAGHDVCAAQPWMTGQEPAADGTFAWHPLARGMDGAATAVYTQLTGRRPPS